MTYKNIANRVGIIDKNEHNKAKVLTTGEYVLFKVYACHNMIIPIIKLPDSTVFRRADNYIMSTNFPYHTVTYHILPNKCTKYVTYCRFFYFV